MRQELRRAAGQQEPLRQATGRCCGRQDTLLRAARSRRTGGRSRTTGVGSVARLGGRDTIGVAGKEPMHRTASVIVPDGSRFCRWQEPLHRNGMSHCTGWQEPLRRAAGAQGAGRQEPPLRQAEGDAAPCGRSSSRWRYCCGRQELLRRAAGDTAPTAEPMRRRQEPLHWGRIRRCCLRQEPLHREVGAAALGRQDTRLETLLRAAGDVACKRRVPLRWQQQPGRSPRRAAGPFVPGWQELSREA